MTGLETLYDPRSVAVVGASASPTKWGHWLARGALTGAHRRSVWLVGRGGTVLGRACHRRLTDLPDQPELVVVAVPGRDVAPVVADCLAVGARCVVVITTDVAGPAGNGLSGSPSWARDLKERGVRLLGPNCMGLVDPGTDLRLTWGEFSAGDIALVSQSGSVGLEIGRQLARSGQGISRFVSLGNQWDIDVCDVIHDLVDHDATLAIGVYLEHVSDGGRLVDEMRRARQAGKPVLLLSVGSSEAAGRAARSHTGALVTDLAVLDAACRAAGAVRVSSAGHLVDAAEVLLSRSHTNGRRIAVVGDSGGHGALAADALVATGLEVGPLAATTMSAALEAVLPAGASVGNPVDLAGAGETDMGNYARVAEGLMDDQGIDAVVLTGYFGDYAGDAPALAAEERMVAERLAEAAAATATPLVVHSLARDTPAVAALRQGGVAVFERIEQAAEALGTAITWWANPPTGPDSSSALAAGTAGTDDSTGSSARAGRRRNATEVVDDGYLVARELLAGYGVPFADASVVGTVQGAVSAADRLGYPVVLKAMGVLHKSDAGAVAVGLADAAAVERSAADMDQRLRPPAWTVEPLITYPGAVELLVGVRRDRSFGPVLMVALGGTTTEIDPDSVVALAPLAEDAVDGLLQRLRRGRLLRGWRGARPVDIGAIARVVTALGRAAADHPELAELEINPLLAHPGGAVALDARVVHAGP